MDDAYAFMEVVRAHSVHECGERLAYLPDVVESNDIVVQFSAKAHVDDRPRLYYLREGLTESFVKAAEEFNDRGWILKIEDAFRSIEMQRGLSSASYVLDVVLDRVRWECGGARPSVSLVRRRLAALCANWTSVATHMAGSALDISVINATTGEEVDRGGPYIDLSEKTPMYSPFVGADQLANRVAIVHCMGRHGFVAYPYEFWHFSQGDSYAAYLAHAPQTARYGPVTFDPQASEIEPIDPEIELNSGSEWIAYVEERMLKVDSSASPVSGGDDAEGVDYYRDVYSRGLKRLVSETSEADPSVIRRPLEVRHESDTEDSR